MGMDWPRLLAYITGTVDQEPLLRNEYLTVKNRILKAQIQGPLLTDAERATLAEIGHRLGRKALEEVNSILAVLSIVYPSALFYRLDCMQQPSAIESTDSVTISPQNSGATV
jgi:hypothetical protein